MSKSVETVDREALYLEVWTHPVVVVAQRYGLSDVGLAKICRNLAIPLPSRGYWAKVKAGRVMKRVPLPRLKLNQTASVRLTKLSPDVVEAKVEARQKAAAARKRFEEVALSAELINPHPLIKAAEKRLKQKNGWTDPKGLRSAPEEVLNLQVTEDSIDRALRIADALIKELENQGVEVRLDTTKKSTYFNIKGTSIFFAMTEHVARARHEPTPEENRARERYWNRSRVGSSASLSFPSIPDYDYTPTGMLTISAGHWPSRNWRDTPRTSLDDRLGDVVAGLFSLAEETRVNEEEKRRREEERCRAEERYQFLKDRLETEQQRFKQLENEAINLERANRLRAYANAVEQKALACVDGLTSEVREWLAWTRAKADWLDPLINICDPILDAPEPKKPGYGYW